MVRSDRLLVTWSENNKCVWSEETRCTLVWLNWRQNPLRTFRLASKACVCFLLRHHRWLIEVGSGFKSPDLGRIYLCVFVLSSSEDQSLKMIYINWLEIGEIGVLIKRERDPDWFYRTLITSLCVQRSPKEFGISTLSRGRLAAKIAPSILSD